MKIAIISPEFPPLTNWGGVATFSKNLSLLLKENGHQVEVFTYSENIAFIKIENGIKIHYIPHKTNLKIFNFLYFRFPFSFIKKLIKKILPTTFFTLEWNLFLFSYFKKLNKNKKSFDAIHVPTYYWSGFLIKHFFKNIKVINHIQGTQFINKKFEKQTLDGRIKDSLEKIYISKTSDKVVCCSEHIFEEIKKNFHHLKNKTTYIQNFSILKKDVQKETNFNNLIFLGRMEPRKGVDILLKSFVNIAKNNKNLKLFLIGENGWGFKLDKNITDFYTFIEKIDIPKQIKNRILIFPNIKNRNTLLHFIESNKGIAVLPSKNEAFGFVITEAMSLGLITITGNKEGGAEIIENTISGFNSNINVKDLTKTIKHVLGLSKKQKQLIEKNARQRIKKLYDVSSVRKKYIKLYKQLFK